MSSSSRLVSLSFLGLVGLTQVLFGHGSMIDPISRVYMCREEGPENPKSEACKAAKEVGGAQQFYNWTAVSQGGANSNHKSVVPDGMLCSGGSESYAGLDIARTDWPATAVSANEEYTIKYFQTAPHATKYFKYYITKDSYDASEPLKWDDLELFCEEGAQPGESQHEVTCTMPNKTGKHILYSVWQRSDSMEAFYSCSDVDFSPSGNSVMVPESPTDDKGSVNSDNSNSGMNSGSLPKPIEPDNSIVEDIADSGSWDESKIYVNGDTATYNGRLYKAAWWTRGNIPGAERWGPWKDQGKAIAPSTGNSNGDRDIVKENIKPTMNVFAPMNKQIFSQDKLDHILIEFNANDMDGTVDSVMAMINGKHYNMNNFAPYLYRLEWVPKSFGSHTIKLYATDNKMGQVIKTINIDVIQR